MLAYALYDQLTGNLHHFTAHPSVLAHDAVLTYLAAQEEKFEVNDHEYWKNVLTHISQAKSVEDLIGRMSEANMLLSVLSLEEKGNDNGTV